MGSNWNTWMDAICDSDLTVAEHRLAAALARELLGWRKTFDQIGEKRLRSRARLHGRSFERARGGLVAKGLLRFTAGNPGRAGAGTYELVLSPIETPAPQRAIQNQETPAPHRAKPTPVNARSQSTKTPAPERARIGSKGKNPPAPPGTPKTFQARVIDAYCGAGGTLELTDARGALLSQATSLARSGTAERLIVAAAASLGRERGFPGYLTQRVRALEEAGGPCQWQGLDRSKLTTKQLSECECLRCSEWLAAAQVPGLALSCGGTIP